MTAPGGKLAAVAAAASFPDLSRLGRAVASDPVVVLILSCNYEAHKPLGTAPAEPLRCMRTAAASPYFSNFNEKQQDSLPRFYGSAAVLFKKIGSFGQRDGVFGVET